MDFRMQPTNGHGSLQRYSPKPTNCDRMRWSFVASICIFYLLTVHVPSTCAGNTRSLLLQRIVRDVFSIAHEESRTNDAASNQTTVNLPQPGQCLLDGILVAETTVFCEKQLGCRAIQKTGYCCPNYKCDCEKNGRLYSNGDKLVDPETPCTVCYCQGGEILCSSVTCFHRDDCKPKFVSGRCCPEYDNCPVSFSEPTLNKTSVNETAKSDLPASIINNPKITIKEITKPTEIRITDDNRANTKQQIAIKTNQSQITNIDPPTQQSQQLNFDSSSMHRVLLSRLTNEKSHFDANENPIQSVIDTANAGENDAAHHDPSKINNKREYSITTEPAEFTTTVTETHTSSKTAQLSDSRKTSAEIEPDTAGSENIYHIIMTTDGPRRNITSWQKFADTSNKLEKTIYSMPITESWSTIEEIGKSNNYTTIRPEVEKNTTDMAIRLSQRTLTTSDKFSQGMLHNMEEDDITIPIESNPAYPSLPIEDFSLRDVNFPLSDIDDNADDRDEPRSIGISYNKPKVTTSHIDEYTTDGSGSGMIMEYFKPTADVFRESTTTENIVKYPEKIELMFSAEDSSEETSVLNNTDFHSEQFMKELENETGSGEALNLYSVVMIPNLEHGSGDAMASKDKSYRREPTTPRPTKSPAEDIDLDDLKPKLGDDKLEPIEDPKLDVESLKLDENDEIKFTNSNTMMSNGNAITINTSPKHDKRLVELDVGMLMN